MNDSISAAKRTGSAGLQQSLFTAPDMLPPRPSTSQHELPQRLAGNLSTAPRQVDRLDDPHYLTPRPVHGWKFKYAGILLENPGWRIVKDELKGVAHDARWPAFLGNDLEAGVTVRAAMRPVIEALPAHQQKFAGKAMRYEKRKGREADSMLRMFEGKVTGAVFKKKGTSLEQDIRRTRNGLPFRVLDSLDDIHTEAIEQQTGVAGFTQAKLGEGGYNVVRVAETIAADGRRDRMLAAKMPIEPFEGLAPLLFELHVLGVVPKTDAFERVRDSFFSTGELIALQELAAGGTVQSIKHQLHHRARTRDLDDSQKEEVWIAVARLCIDHLAQFHAIVPAVRHRDIKANNFLVAPEVGHSTRIILSDFGVAAFPRTDRMAADQAATDRMALVAMLHLDFRRYRRDEPLIHGRGVQHSGWATAMEALGDASVPLPTVLEHSIFQATLTADALTRRLAILRRAPVRSPDQRR